MNVIIRKAERRKALLRCVFIGISGSGKTYSSLMLAKGLGGKVCVIDTENRSADLYANEFDYDVAELHAPFTPYSYIEAIKSIERAGYDVIIIDSLTHAWAGEGGSLDMKDNLDKSSRGGNGFTNWRTISKEHNLLVNAILQSSCHIIATMRSKTHYDMQEDEKGRKVPVKIGLAPVQRDGMEYEFTIVFDVSQNHFCDASKDRTNIFKSPFIMTEKNGQDIEEWLNTGKEESDITKDMLHKKFEEYQLYILQSKDNEELKNIYSECFNFFKNYQTHPDTKQYREILDNLKDSIKKGFEQSEGPKETLLNNHKSTEE